MTAYKLSRHCTMAMSWREKVLALLTVLGVCTLVYDSIGLQAFSIHTYNSNMSHVTKQDVAYHAINDDQLRCLNDVRNSHESKQNKSKRCRVLDFMDHLNTKNKTSEQLDTWLLSDCHYTLYNAVPKCGSRTLQEVFIKLAEQHNHSYYTDGDIVGMNPYREGEEILNKYYRQSEVNIPTYKRKHFFFLDFVRNVETPRVMLNLIREPVDHVTSIYNWLAFGDGIRNQTKGNQTLSLGECLKKFGPVGICIKWRLLALPYFFGNEVHPTAAVVQKAKWHVENTYLLVGLIEDYTTFLSTLETLLPHLFCNATNIYKQVEADSRAIYQTKTKLHIPEETKSILRDHLQHNIDFYHFVKQRFYYIVDLVNRHRHYVSLNSRTVSTS